MATMRCQCAISLSGRLNSVNDQSCALRLNESINRSVVSDSAQFRPSIERGVTPTSQAGLLQVRLFVAGHVTHPYRCQRCQAAILILLLGGGPCAMRLSNAASVAASSAAFLETP